MRTSVERNDASVVIRLDNLHHVSRTLHDLRLGGHATRNLWRPSVPGDATRVGAWGLHVVALRLFGSGGGGLTLLGFFEPGRNSAIRRIHNQRRAPVRSDRALPLVHPIFF